LLDFDGLLVGDCLLTITCAGALIWYLTYICLAGWKHWYTRVKASYVDIKSRWLHCKLMKKVVAFRLTKSVSLPAILLTDAWNAEGKVPLTIHPCTALDNQRPNTIAFAMKFRRFSFDYRRRLVSVYSQIAYSIATRSHDQLPPATPQILSSCTV
jgi:hypothetical protein